MLEAVHGYTKHFFGCTECSTNFDTMAVEENMWNATSKNEAIIWLWSAHNIVSDRLTGDSTDDPEFPKIKFPSHEACPECRQYKCKGGYEFTWVNEKVLPFLKDMHSENKISVMGI